MTGTEKTPNIPFARGGGELGERMRALDWTSTVFGTPESWPPSLRQAVSLCINSALPTAIYWGPERALIYNDAWAPIAGEKHPWALGRPARDVWPDIWHIIEPQLEKVFSSGEGFSVTDQMLPMRRGGRIQRTHWDYSFAPLFDQDGLTVQGIFNQGNETTARILAERALRASEQRLEYALGSSNTVGTWDWDVPGDRVTADARFASLYGVEPDLAAAGVPISEFFRNIHPDDRPLAEATIEDAMRSGDMFSVEYRLLAPDGSVRWVTAQGRCTMAPDGTVLRIPGISFDITKLKETEAALRDSEARFRAITDSIEQMIWSTRPDGYHDYYNQRWYDYTGTPEGSTDGEGWKDMFHPDDRERATLTWQHCLASGEPYHIEYRLRHHSGAYRWVLGRAQPVRNEKGRIIRWFGTCTDIQEIVDAREVLARSREELEREVEERTAALLRTQEQLRQAQKMEAIGQLTGGIAHDFNNMLAVMIGGLNLIERRLAKGETDLGRYIDAAKDGAERAAALTRRLLAFSRKQPLEPRVVEPNRLVSGMTELLVRTLGEHVKIETVLAAGAWPVNVDVSQLENVILNLAVNARDAMPEGGRLTIETSNAHIAEEYGTDHDVAPGQYVMLAITDTGSGMPPDVAARAFDPFFTTKATGKGTGLGLSQVFGFVRQSDGHVKIYSEVGHGTSVKVYLPRYYGKAEPVPVKPPNTENLRGSEAETILVVEDDEQVRAFSAETLRELGYGVVEAGNGAQALEILQGGKEIALLFTDVVMPEMSGPQLVEIALQHNPALKVLYTTGYTRNSIVHNGILDAGTHLIQKPFSMDQLGSKVRSVLDS